MKTLLLTFLIFFTMSLGLSSFAKAFEADCSEKVQSFCQSQEFQNTSSSDSSSSEHDEEGKHNNCLAHCAHFVGLPHSSEPGFYLNDTLSNLNIFYAFFLISPDLDGPFRPPLA